MWSIPVIFFCVLTIGCACFTMLCKWCCKACREEDVVNNPQEPIRGPPIPPPAFAPPTPSANQFRDPPPYNEVAWKPYLYPPPVGQPPAYDNIAMVDLSFVDISQPPASVPKVTSEELYVSATTMPEH
ncbi:uncharacterized protein LOC133366339 [Rhineura floridana]|uniref:uncharacterized protein LOC133366339 n=1 Tax=Rhineura floridana TaxID=261503 RepID=UPI002AC80926|nr:uncharacterized protein LOC133366339 [Rhineura floridana]